MVLVIMCVGIDSSASCSCVSLPVVCQCQLYQPCSPPPCSTGSPQALEIQNKAHSSRAGILEGVGGTMKSLTAAQEATGRAHITIQVPLLVLLRCAGLVLIGAYFA